MVYEERLRAGLIHTAGEGSGGSHGAPLLTDGSV